MELMVPLDFVSSLQLNSYLWTGLGVYWLISAIFVQKTKASESLLQRWSHLSPMIIGFMLIFHSGMHFHHSLVLSLIGNLITLKGLLFPAVWARISLGKYWSGAVTLKVDHKLIRTGPYRFVRHPIYTGLLSGMLGSALCAGTCLALFGFLSVLVTFIVKLWREEDLLTSEFGEEYRQFMRETPMLVPFTQKFI